MPVDHDNPGSYSAPPEAIAQPWHNLEQGLCIFQDFLRTARYRVTTARLEVARQALTMEGHFDAEKLCALAHTSDCEASRATVYRTLGLLVESGLLLEKDLGYGLKTYEHTHQPKDHDHLICHRCGRVIEYNNDTLIQVLTDIAVEHGFCIKELEIKVSGLCQQCRQDT